MLLRDGFPKGGAEYSKQTSLQIFYVNIDTPTPLRFEEGRSQIHTASWRPTDSGTTGARCRRIVSKIQVDINFLNS